MRDGQVWLLTIVLHFETAIRQHGRQLWSRKKAVSSPATAAASSTGAKCPPLGKTVQRWML